MSRWLTPVWLLGGGVAVGLAALAVLLGILMILSKFPFFEKLPKQGLLAHILALIGAVVLGATTAWMVRPGFQSELGEFRSDEWLLVAASHVLLFGLLTWTLAFCANSRFLGEIKSVLFEGIGGYLLGTAATIAAVGLICTVVADEPLRILASLPQLFQAGEVVHKVTVPGVKSDEVSSEYTPLEIEYQPNLIERVSIRSNRNIVIADAPTVSLLQMPPVSIVANEPREWSRKQKESPPIPMGDGAQIFAQNTEIDDAELVFTLRSLPAVPEVSTILVAALTVIGFGLLFFLQQGVAPKAAAVALAAAKSEVGQPLFLVLIGIGSLCILLGVFMPFYTFGEDIKLLKDCGITVILILALFQGIWSASSSVSEEIEGRTALTVLSKPIGRRSFLFGKILGVFWLILLMFMILGSFELLAIAYKPLYDAREGALDTPLWEVCHREMARTVPGLAMGLFHSVTLSAFAVAFATRIPQLANFTLCFSIYLLGHLTQSILVSAEGGFAILQFVAQLIAVIIPDLEHFSMQAAIDTENPIPMSYLAGTLLYSLLYTGIAVLLGLLLFEDRDLA
ncbi:MAG: hypothetical protein U0905_22225 [Pirellulales bacterium]